MLRSLGRSGDDTRRGFPFDVPAIRALETLEFPTPVTCFAGENGSGKSTLLEALAVASGLPALGGADPARDPTLAPQRRLAETLRLRWHRGRTATGFFARAEDYLGYVTRLRGERQELEAELERIDREYTEQDRSAYARTLAMGPARGSLDRMTRRYGEDPDARSHGEGFLHLFRERIVPGGLYLMDEPEAALSPQSQLALLLLIAEAVRAGSQFILATHSPILLALPEATIYAFDEPPIRAVVWEELPGVALLRDFLAGPGRFLRALES